MPREIEVKTKLTPEQKTLLQDWLEKHARFVCETHQVEHYLDNPEKSLLFTNKNGFLDSDHYLRVRIDQKGDSVCLKIFKIDQEKNTSENLDEIEFTVSSGPEALKLLRALGFTKAYTIEKTRRKYESEQFEIVIDEVKGLGSFAEVELKEQIDDDIKVGYAKIYEFLKSLGFTEIDEQHRGYFSMVWNPTYDFGKLRTL